MNETDRKKYNYRNDRGRDKNIIWTFTLFRRRKSIKIQKRDSGKTRD